VWWTLGGLGAWRMGAQRLDEGTADFAEGILTSVVDTHGGTASAFCVASRCFRADWDATAAPLHATRWPAVRLVAGQPVRVWFFGPDVLRLEVAEAQAGW
jgi:hypothetical protein